MDPAQLLKPAIATAAIIAIAVVLTILGSRREAGRRKEVEGAAVAGGWETGYFAPAGKFYELRGNVGTVSNAVARPDGSCAVFDYEFTRRPFGSSRLRHQVEQTVVYVRSDRLALPVMSIEPKKVWSPIDRDRIIATVNFAHAYEVRSQPGDGVVGERAREYLMQNPGIAVEGSGSEIFLFRPGTIATPDQIGAFMAWGESLARMFEQRVS